MVSDICLKNANDKRDSSMYVYVKRLFMLLAAQLSSNCFITCCRFRHVNFGLRSL